MPGGWARSAVLPRMPFVHGAVRCSTFRLCARQQEALYPGDPGMVGASLDYEHGGLYGPGAELFKDFWRE